MKFLQDLIKNNPFTALLLPTALSGASFIGHLIVALSGDQIDWKELHDLMSSANGLETLLLMIIMVALKKPKKK